MIFSYDNRSKKTLADFDGKKKVLSVVPSIDTEYLLSATRRFNQELANLDNTVVLTVSMDLPFAQVKRRTKNEPRLAVP